MRLLAGRVEKAARHFLKHRPVWFLPVCLGCGVLLIVVLGLTLRHRQTKPNPTPSIITYSTDTPDESKPKAERYVWTGGDTDPKKIIIPKLGIDSYIEHAGVDQYRKVAVPDNVHLAGWFVDSRRPGENGLAVIAGHVTGRSSDGIFKHLDQLKPGDNFEIELGNGETRRYAVVSTKQVKEATSADVVFSQDPAIKSQLNLITCGGSFNNQTKQYNDRIIVTSELKS